MPIFGRVNGEWVEGDLRMRADGEWTDENDAVFGRLAGAWVQCQPDPAGSLVAPQSLVATPTDNAATLTWTNPTQDATPTEIQIRIPEITSVWTEIGYPSTTLTWAALAASTAYQFQARYIIREDGEITATGPTATVFFTTLALAGPGTPAADPGGTGPDSTTYWPPLTGGGAVGSGDCWWGYVVEEFDVDTYTWSSSATNGEVAGTGFDLDLDFIALGFECGQVLRYKYREICNSVPQAWEYGLAFNVVCDYDDPCGGINQTTAFAAAPFDDAILAMPKICYEDARSKIEDYVTDTVEYGKLPGLNLPLYIDSAWQLVASDSLGVYGAGLAAGHVPALVPVGSAVPALTSDFSFTIDVWPEQQILNGSGAPVKIADIGDTVKIYMYDDGAGVRFSAGFGKQGGGQFDLASSTVLALGEWHTITLTIDQDGEKILYIDGAEDVTEVDTTRANFAAVTGNVALYGNDQMRVRKVAAWDRALTELEALIVGSASLYARVLQSAPSFYAPLRETSGSVATDIVGSKTGAIGANVALSEVSGGDGFLYPRFSGATSGITNYVIDFANDALFKLNTSGQGLSLMVLVRPTTVSGSRAILLHESNWGARADNGIISADIRSGANTASESPASSFDLNVWRQVIVTYTGISGAIAIYADGVLIASAAPSGTGGTPSNPLRIGSALIGAAAHITLWDRVLDLTEVQDLFAAFDGEAW